MELIYSMRRKPLRCEPPNFESISDPDITRPICTISVCNIIAFSSPTELSDAEGDSWGGHVYVCDLDTPWDSHKVTSTPYPVTTLEWDSDGKQLLVATTMGEVSIFGQKDYLLNEWTCLYSATFPGEHIVRATFFHNGRRIVALEKKPDAPITDRIQILRSTPTLKGFGGVACEGACIVTASGLLGAVTAPLPQEPSKALSATECLRAAREHLTRASFAHKNGNLLIAAVCQCAGGRGCVRCYVCSAARGIPPAPTLTVQPLPTIYLDDLHSAPTSLTWCLREDTDSLLVGGGQLSLWKLTERSHPVHKLLAKGPLQGSTTPGGGPKPGTDCFNTVAWQQTTAWPVEGGEGRSQVASCRLPLAPPYVLLATSRNLYLRARDNHHYVCSASVVCGLPESAAAAGSTPPKKHKYGPAQLPSGVASAVVCDVDASWLGGVCVCVDSYAQLHVYKLPQPWTEIPMPLAVQHASTLVEFSLVSGYDCLDVLITLKHNIIDAVYERLTESFQRQPPTFQQYYYHSWLKMRTALCRMSPLLQTSAGWLTSVQNLYSAWAASGAALRPDDRPELATFAALFDEHSIEHDKSLLTLESKSEVSSEVAVLGALRRPLQRALDIAGTVLAAVAAGAPHHHSHGYELWNDPSALALLRRVMAVARACGRGPDALGRALGRLAAAGPAPPKPDLVEECAALSSQMPSARVWEALPRCAVSAPHGRPWPFYLEYGVAPGALRHSPEPPAYAQRDVPAPAMDSIRYMYLGGGWSPARWRQCPRCGALALPAALPGKTSHQRAYDARFLPTCRCGGKWTLFSNV